MVPALRNADLAAGFTRLVIAALLRAYQCGARAARNATAARRLLVEQLGPDAAVDVLEGCSTRSATRTSMLGPRGVDAIVALAREHLPSQRAPTQDPTQGLVPTDASAILRVTGRNQRPPRSDRLRI